MMNKILLVEDNEMNRDMLSRRLERKGFEVVIAVGGQAGVDMATTARGKPSNMRIHKSIVKPVTHLILQHGE